MQHSNNFEITKLSAKTYAAASALKHIRDQRWNV